jgi:hypothetical protein
MNAPLSGTPVWSIPTAISPHGPHPRLSGPSRAADGLVMPSAVSAPSSRARLFPHPGALPASSTGKLRCRTILNWPIHDKTGNHGQRNMLDDVISQNVTREAVRIYNGCMYLGMPISRNRRPRRTVTQPPSTKGTIQHHQHASHGDVFAGPKLSMLLYTELPHCSHRHLYQSPRHPRRAPRAVSQPPSTSSSTLSHIPVRLRRCQLENAVIVALRYMAYRSAKYQPCL